MKFEIYKDNAGKFRFRLKAGNGQTILASESYETKAGCKNGAQSVITNSPLDERYERKESSNGKFFFNLRAGNSQVIGTSEMYDTAQGREKGIESVKNSAKGADVVDLTVA
ncbi:MAG: YegP family protein [Saprospiraceae bacterium]|nr:YegP family protein [Saprospiraceae bacterium]